MHLELTQAVLGMVCHTALEYNCSLQEYSGADLHCAGLADLAVFKFGLYRLASSTSGWWSSLVFTGGLLLSIAMLWRALRLASSLLGLRRSISVLGKHRQSIAIVRQGFALPPFHLLSYIISNRRGSSSLYAHAHVRL
jgi:hypothetical protein